LWLLARQRRQSVSAVATDTLLPRPHHACYDQAHQHAFITRTNIGVRGENVAFNAGVTG
jgi:hypothetical protein